MHALQQGGRNELSPYFWRKESRAIFLGSAYPAVEWHVIVGCENDEAQALYNFSQFAFHASEFLVPALKCTVFLVEWVALVTVKWRKHRCPLQRIGNGYDRDVQGIEQPGLQPDARRDTSKRSIVVTADGRAVSSQVKQWKHFSKVRNGDGVPVSVSFFDPSSLLACHVLAFLCTSRFQNTITPHPAGDHKGPHHTASSTLAPTDIDGLVLGLMRIGRPQGSPQQCMPIYLPYSLSY